MHQYLLINLKNLERNLNFIKRLAPKSQICPVLKSDAYGLGLKSIVSFLFWKCRIAQFSVGTVEEAFIVRGLGIQFAEILLLKSALATEYADLYKYKILPSISSISEFQSLNAYTLHTKLVLKYHLKIDTGLGRFGFSKEDFESKISDIFNAKYLEIEGIYSHLASPWKEDNTSQVYSQLQFDLYRESVEKAKKIKNSLKTHLLGSGGILFYPQFLFDWVRPGILLFGGYLSLPKVYEGQVYDVVTWKVKILSFKKAKKASYVGYQFAFQFKEDRDLAILGSGYGFGYPRVVSHGGFFAYSELRKEEKLPVIWVGMDTMAIDVTKSSLFLKPGDELILMGDSFNVNELAFLSNQVSHEILTNISKSITRFYVYEA